MVYQGSKNRLAKYIVPIIQEYIDTYNCKTYIELFVGGANIIDKVECEERIGADYNENVINLLRYIQKDTEISIAPKECSFEHYADVRANQYTGKYSKEYVALIGYCASYGGRYFDGGYGRDAKGGRSIYTERVKNLQQQAPNLKDITFIYADYANFDYTKYKNCVFYMDPPYNGTKTYAKQKINYEHFYDMCEKIAKENIVIVSEYHMPEDQFECIWQKERKILQKSDRDKGKPAIEKLWICKQCGKVKG